MNFKVGDRVYYRSPYMRSGLLHSQYGDQFRLASVNYEIDEAIVGAPREQWKNGYGWKDSHFLSELQEEEGEYLFWFLAPKHLIPLILQRGGE